MPRTRANQVFRLEVTLAEIEPPAWLRLVDANAVNRLLRGDA